MFYSLCGSAIFIVFIVVCFHSEIKRICNCVIPTRKNHPEIAYTKNPEQITIGRQTLNPMERSSQNRDGQATEIPLNNPAISKKKKGAVASNGPECPIPTAQSIVPGGLTDKAKTTNLKSTSDPASAETGKRGSVRFMFPNVKRQEKL